MYKKGKSFRVWASSRPAGQFNLHQTHKSWVQIRETQLAITAEPLQQVTTPSATNQETAETPAN